jgi:hypothetical protein
MLYASTGLSLARIAVTEDTYSVWARDDASEVQFIGVGGRLLAARKLSPDEKVASYKILGSERYVRARISDAQGHMAWTPAVRIGVAPRPSAREDGPRTKPSAADLTSARPPG